MFTVTRLSQFDYIGRILNEICTYTLIGDIFAEYYENGYTTTLRQLCYAYKSNDIFAFEMNTASEKYKLCIRFECKRMSRWCDIDVIRTFGMRNIRSRWTSVIISPEFHTQLNISQTILKRMFNRIQTGDTSSTTNLHFQQNEKQTFNRLVQQPCHERIHAILRDQLRSRRIVCQFRKDHLFRRTWKAWLDHYYDPDNQNGYMNRYISRLDM